MVRELADGRGLVKLSVAQTRILNGDEDLSSWTEAELEYGAKRGKDGRFRKKPRVIAQAVHDELVRRKMTKAFSLLRESVHDSVALLRSIVLDPDADGALRVKCAETILDRVLGKPKESIALDVQAGQAPWQVALANAIVGSVEEASEILEREAGIVEGEIVEGETVEK
jgi:hypothetical protein